MWLVCLLRRHRPARWRDGDGRSVTCLRCGRHVTRGTPGQTLTDLYR